MEYLAEAIPTIIRLLVPFIPILAALVNKIPTPKTDPLEERLRHFHSLFDGKTAQEIAEMGKVMRELKE